MRGPVSPIRIKSAWVVAVGMDALQMLLFPTTIEGGFSPVADGLDFVAMALLWGLVGWHWTFLPSVIVKVIPVMDLAPTWTIALAIASRGLNARAPAPGHGDNPLPRDVTPSGDARTIAADGKSGLVEVPGNRG
jgi:hypothetical protein